MDIYLPPDITIQQLPPAAPGAGAADTAEGVAVGAAGPAGPAAQLGAAREQPGASGVPVVLFCHGGVWASGAKWHYAPMATRLAQAGIVTAVMQVRHADASWLAAGSSEHWLPGQRLVTPLPHAGSRD